MLATDAWRLLGGYLPSCFAGTPATVAPVGTSLLTIAPAPTVAPSPIFTNGVTVAPAKIEHPRPTRTPPHSVAEGAIVQKIPDGIVVAEHSVRVDQHRGQQRPTRTLAVDL
eukprot:SAG11_NODE_13468_length_654_cov_0.686486_1_plen_110_part_10